MSFNPNIPTVNDKTLQSFYQLRANFQAIARVFGENHVGLTQDASVSGMHNLLNFQTSSDPTTSATQIALYTKLVSSVPQLFFRPSSDQTPIQMTYTSVKADSSNTQNSFVAGPFIIYGGFISAPTNGQVVNLTPGSNLIFVDTIAANLKIVQGIKTQVVIPTAISGASFTITFTGSIARPFDIFYFAIGLS